MSPQRRSKGYSSTPLSFSRRMVIASVAINKRTAIHDVTELDVTEPRRMIREWLEKTGERISFTAYLVRCFARTLEQHPGLNSFILRRRLVILEDVTVSVLVERELNGEKVPEPMGINAAQKKTIRQVHEEIRAAQAREGKGLGDLTNSTWIRWIPSFLLKTFVRIANQNLGMAQKYGKVSVTAVGMFSQKATWFIPHGTATVLLTVGSITTEPVWNGEKFEPREILHLTASFDHEIVDGAPAARFMKDLTRLVESGELWKEEV